MSDREMRQTSRHGVFRGIVLRLARPVLLAALLVLPIRPALEAAAATIIVNTTIDPGGAGVCALRDAITAANSQTAVNGCAAGTGTDTIDFNLNGMITLGSNLPPIMDNLTIDATGQTITVDGDDLYQVFTVNAGFTVFLNSLTIQRGSAPSGGAVNNAGTLTVTNSAFLNNKASTANGGAISNLGTLTVNNTTFSLNAAGVNGGAIDSETGSTLTVNSSTFSSNTANPTSSGNGGAIDSEAGSTLTTVTNSTFSGNMAGSVSGGGGGVYSASGTASVVNSTFSGNTSFAGASVDNAGGTLTVSNSILATNSSTLMNCGGSIIDGGYNISANPNGSDTSCGFAGTGENGDPIGNSVSNANLALGPLANNGGPTETLAPQLTQLTPNLIGYAIDAVPLANCTVHTDQRGNPRPAPGFNACDIGAYEGAYQLQTQLTVANVTAAPGAAFNVAATLSPVGSGLCGEGQIIFTFQSNLQSALTTGGVANSFFFAPATGGTYELQASYAGGGLGSPCGPATATALVTVPGPSTAAPTALAVANVTASPGSSFTVTATLSSNTSACTSGQPVTFTFQNASATATTGPNGVASATYAAPFTGGPFSVLATFAGNSSCAPSTNAGIVTLSAPSSTTLTVQNFNETVPSTFNATATLSSSASGCSVSGQTIEFTLLSSPPQTASGTTNGSGMVTMALPAFTTPSTPGTYTIQASFSGVSPCGSTTGSGLLTVTSPTATATALTVANVTVPEGATFVAAAGLVGGGCAANQQILFTFRGAQGFGTTNSNGVANVTFTAPTTPGPYAIQASFAGSPSCDAGSATGQVTVPAPTPTTLTVSNVTARPATLFTAMASLKPASCAGGQSISFTFNASTRTSFTNLSGQATTDFVAPGTTGSLPIQASFAGTPYCAPSSNSAVLNVQGAAGPPILNVLPGSVSFGSQPLGVGSLQTITVSNDASTAVNVSSITIASGPGTSGAPFTETDTCVPSVGPRSQCSISVGYTPTVAARQTASLQIHLNNTSTKTVPMNGTGIVVGSAVPSRIAYGSQKLRTTSNSSQVTVTNNLTGGLAIAAVSTSGDFVVTKNECASVLKSRSSCKIRVAFDPTATGTRNGTLTIIDTISSVPLTVTLTGNGSGD